MAKDVKFNIKLSIDGKEQIVTASTNVKRLAQELELAQTETARFRDALLKINQTGQAFQNAFSGLQQITGLMQEYTAANAVQREAETKLTTVMRQRMGATDSEIESVKKLAAAQQELGVIGDEVQLAGAQQIATFLKEKSSLDVLIPAMNNLIAHREGLKSTTEGAVSVGNLMGKAMMGQVDALKRVGISFDEAQARVIKYGTESQKAAMLAQVITDNVGNMNAELAKTDAGKAKQTADKFGDLKEEIGAVFAPIETTVIKVGQLSLALNAMTTTASGIVAVTKAIQMMNVAAALTAVRAKAAALAQALWNKQLYYGKTAMYAWTFGAKAAAAQAIATRVAIMGLMAATGVGLAIMAVSSIMSLFASKTDDATDSMKKANREMRNSEEEAARLKDIEQATADAYTNASATLEINKEKLKNLIAAKNSGKDTSNEEKKIIEQLNGAYGDTMGYFDSVAKWYNALIRNSEDYCRQMVIEAKTRQLANQIAEKEAETHNLIYDDKGNKKKYNTKRETRRVATGQVDAGDGKILPVYETQEVIGTSEVEKINQQVKDNRAVIANLQRQMRDAVTEAGRIEFKVKGSSTRPGSAGSGGSKGGGGGKGGGKEELKLIADAATYKELTNNVSYYQQELEKADIADTERILTLARAKQAAEEAVSAFKNLADAASMSTELKSLDDYDKKLQYLRKQRQTANKEAIAGIDAEIERIEAARQALENESIAALRDDEIKSYDQLNKKAAYYNSLLNSGDEQQRRFAQNGINALTKLQEAWDSSLAEAKLPATTNTVKDIDAAISFYSDRQQREDADQIGKTQAVIDQLTAKKKVLQLGVELPQMQREIAEIDAMTGRERTLKIRGIGFEELTNKIKELNKLLNDKQNPVTDDQRKEIESIIATYEKWRNQSISSFDTIKSGWGSVQGVGNGIQGITDALEGNGDAWQQIAGFINGFIAIAEGIQGIVSLIEMLTITTTAHSAAATVDAAATAGETAASVANTSAKSGEAVANATASGAKLAFPYNLIAIAAGVAAVISALSMIGSFSTGGIVGGNSPTGDKLLARVNSGEMILNKKQQMRLLQLLSGIGVSYPALKTQAQTVRVDYNVSPRVLEQATSRIEVVGRISGRDIVLVQEKEYNHKKRS